MGHIRLNICIEIDFVLLFQGTLFFPLPDGTGLLFNLQGTADVPKPNGKISREVPCKTTYTELLTVYNWLNKAQRSVVTEKCVKTEPSEENDLGP